MRIALCTELRNADQFENRLRSPFCGDEQVAIDELWNEKQLAHAVTRSQYHAVVIALPGPEGLKRSYRQGHWRQKHRSSGAAMTKALP